MTSNNGKFAPEHRNPGDIILSDDWNAGMQEIVRLESAKVNREGAESLQGPLTIAEALSVSAIAPPTSTPLEIKGALKLAEGVAVNQFSNDSSLSTNSDSIVPTQKAVKTYVDDQLARIKDQIDRINEDLGSPKLGSLVDDLRIKVENKIGNLDEELVKVKKLKVEKVLVEQDILIKGNVRVDYGGGRYWIENPDGSSGFLCWSLEYFPKSSSDLNVVSMEVRKGLLKGNYRSDGKEDKLLLDFGEMM
jgi:hypothetical protein